MIPHDTLESFSRIIEAVEKMFPGSRPVIGGGALRDSYHGRPIKDVDVLIRAKDFNDLSSPHTKVLISESLSSYVGRHDMHGVWDIIEPIEGYQVQLILADFETPEELANTFDIGICRVTFDGRSVFYHEHFNEDSITKTLRIRRMDSAQEGERSERRITRLLKKYPDFTVHPLDWT